MSSILTPAWNIVSAQSFVAALSDPDGDNDADTIIYLLYGKSYNWSNNPPQANGAISTGRELWLNAIGGKKLTAADVHHVVPRFNWTSNTVYNYADASNPDQFNIAHPFYVVNKNWDVFKCLANGQAPSTVSTIEPTSISTVNDLITSDGYTWKYMYSISDNERLRFTTDDYIPVRTLTLDDGSSQWQVQNNTIDGAIHSIVVTNGGQGYTNVANLVITITGDGVSLEAVANINVTSQTVSSIIPSDLSFGYTYATLIISGGGGTGATARVIMGPPGGHGKDPVFELGGRYVMLNPRLINNENGILPTVNDIRQIGLVKNPLRVGTSNVATNSAIFQATTINVIGTGDFFQDEFIYQGPSLAAATFSARVLEWDATNNEIYVINTVGTIGTGTVVGANSSTSRFITNNLLGDLVPYSGHVFYVDNFPPINRSPVQSEDFKITIDF